MEEKLYFELENFLSSWIFVFFLFYYFKISYFNPIILLLVASLAVVLGSIYVYIHTNSVYFAYDFAHVNIFIKLIPIILIIHKPIYYHDIIISLMIIFLYYIYITYYKMFNMIEFYTDMPTNYLIYIKETFLVN